MKTRKQTAPKFENQIRFNWGYHDAVQAVRMGWTNAEHNFGFGPAFGKLTAENILEKHRDSIYARGWVYGYYEAIGSNGAEGSCKTSEFVWKAALTAGQVTK